MMDLGVRRLRFLHLILAQRFLEHKNSVLQLLKLCLVRVLPLLLVKVLGEVPHHNRSDGDQAKLGSAVPVQPVVQPRVDVGEFLHVHDCTTQQSVGMRPNPHERPTNGTMQL